MELLSPNDNPKFKPSVNASELLEQREETEKLSPVDELVSEKLNPRGETDQDGYGREIYSLNGQSFCFRSREELPTYPAAEHSSTTILGSEPKYMIFAATSPDTDSAFYLDQLAKYQNTKNRLEANQSPDKPVHFSVDHSAEGITQLLHHLQPDNEQFALMTKEVSAGQYGEKTLALLDKIASVALIDPESGQPHKTLDSDAEAVVVLAELGDLAAKDIVDRALRALRDYDAINHQSAPLSPTDQRAIKDCGLMVVHSTQYEPADDVGGGFSTKTLFDATGAYPRATIHASLNHKVEAHVDTN